MNNKSKVSWHEENLRNMIESLYSQVKYLEDIERKVKTLKEDCDFLNYQINEAKKNNITEFDRNRFRVKRVKNSD